MAYCVPAHIPHSIFLGRVWPNPDDPSEPYWLPRDRDTALLWTAREAKRCPRCGAFPDDYPKDTRVELPPFAAVPQRCGFCADVETVYDEEVPEDPKERRGVTVGLVELTEANVDEIEEGAEQRRMLAVGVQLDERRLNEPGPLQAWSKPPA